jgi:hypothetical protein
VTRNFVRIFGAIFKNFRARLHPKAKSELICSEMPELPDITVYLEALEPRIRGHKLEKVQITSPFLLRTATPPISSVEGRKVSDLRRSANESASASKMNYGWSFI